MNSYSTVAGDCSAAFDNYGLVTVSVVTKVLPCPANCKTCAKSADTTAFVAADCSAAADGYYLAGTPTVTGIIACNTNCLTCTSTDACSNCKVGYALL
jgi:hypothetical protein